MASHKSAEKRFRQSKRANLKNRAVKSAVRTEAKKLAAVAGQPEAKAKFSEVTSLLDKAVKRGILHRRTAARKKSQLAKMVQKMAATKEANPSE